MKRLIALLVGVTVLLSMSLTSFAAFTDEIPLNADGTTYTATLPSDAATANAGKQATIVAYKGDTIEVGSIEYIDQAAADSFTFQLMNPLTENVKVVMGGEAIDKQEVGTIFFEKEADTYTISGSVANAPTQDFIDEMSSYATEIAGEEAVADYVANYAVTAYLVDMENAEEAIGFCIYETEELTALQTTTVSFVDGTFAFEDVAAGEYLVVLKSDAGLTWIDAVTVEDSNASVGEIEILYGDVLGAQDAIVDGTDVNYIVTGMGDIEAENFCGAFDLNPDCIIDATDVNIAVANMGDITAYGTDFILNNF